MKMFLLILFSILFIVGCDIPTINMTKIELEQTKDTVKTEMQNLRQQDLILAKDYYVAKKALDKAVQERDTATFKLGLKAFSFQIRKDIVEEIKKLNDKSFVPDLAHALEANQGCLSGGSETDFLQQELNTSILSALKKLTKLKFSYVKSSLTSCLNNSASKDVKRILKESREWWKIYRQKNNL